MTDSTLAMSMRLRALTPDRPLRLISWAIVGLLTAALIYPMIVSALVVFDPAHGDIGGRQFQAEIGPVLWDTLVISLGAAAPALAIGVLLAWVNERSNAQLGFLGDVLPMGALLVPQIAGVVGWVVLFDPRIGYANIAIRWIAGLGGLSIESGPFDIYSPAMIILLSSVYLMPYVFLLASAGFQSLDSAMEEAARICGAGPRKTLLTITLPAIAPTLWSILVLVLMRALMMFGIVAALGARANIETLPVYIYHLISSYPSRDALATLLAGGMVLLIQVLLGLEGALMKSGRAATIGGKGAAVRRVDLGAARHPVRAIAVFYLFVTTVAPAFAVLVLSFMPFWKAKLRLSEATLSNYARVFEDPQVSQSLVNSLILGAVGASIVVAISVIITSAHKTDKERRAVTRLTSLAGMVPHTLIGVAFILAYSRAPFFLYDTTTLLLLAYVVMETPLIVQTIRSAAQAVAPELSEAANVSGAGEIRAFSTIQLPLMASSIIGAWILAFLHIKSEVTASALLTGAGNATLGPILLNLSINGNYGDLTALATIVTVMCFVLVFALLLLRRSNADRFRRSRMTPRRP